VTHHQVLSIQKPLQDVGVGNLWHTGCSRRPHGALRLGLKLAVSTRLGSLNSAMSHDTVVKTLARVKWCIAKTSASGYNRTAVRVSTVNPPPLCVEQRPPPTAPYHAATTAQANCPQARNSPPSPSGPDSGAGGSR
jgi:hypothetical protein